MKKRMKRRIIPSETVLTRATGLKETLREGHIRPIVPDAMEVVAVLLHPEGKTVLVVQRKKMHQMAELALPGKVERVHHQHAVVVARPTGEKLLPPVERGEGVGAARKQQHLAGLNPAGQKKFREGHPPERKGKQLPARESGRMAVAKMESFPTDAGRFLFSSRYRGRPPAMAQC